MITGFNTDVDYDGRVFHVQTEDKGRDNPTIESLVYSRGEIVAARNTRYEDLSKSDAYSEDAVMDRMERQHQALIRDILNGKFGAEGPKPFGHSIITNRQLDEVVAEFLLESYTPEPIRLELEEELAIASGSDVETVIRVRLEENDAPAGGAHVTLTLVDAAGDTETLFSAATDKNGQVAANFSVPSAKENDADWAIVCNARMGGATAELRQPVDCTAEAV